MTDAQDEALSHLVDPAVLADEVTPGAGYDLAGAAGSGTAGTAAPGADAPASFSGDAPSAETPGPQPVNPLAAALTLLLASPPHRHLFIADLEWRLLPAIAAGQFRLITKDNRPLAFVTWAFLSDEIKARLQEAMKQPGGASGAGRLKPEEWRSGKNHVIVDFVSPFVTDEQEKKRMLASVFGVKKEAGGATLAAKQ